MECVCHYFAVVIASVCAMSFAFEFRHRFFTWISALVLIVVVAVHWKFIPITAENSIKMSLLQTCVDAEHVRTFYKGAMLSDETLHRLGFANYTEVTQLPGEAVTAHSFHCGLGMQKIAEAHSWFSEPWYSLRLDNAPELPVFFPDWAAEVTTDAPGLPSTMAPASAVPGRSASVKRRKVLTSSSDEAGAAL